MLLFNVINSFYMDLDLFHIYNDLKKHFDERMLKICDSAIFSATVHSVVILLHSPALAFIEL